MAAPCVRRLRLYFEQAHPYTLLLSKAKGIDLRRCLLISHRLALRMYLKVFRLRLNAVSQWHSWIAGRCRAADLARLRWLDIIPGGFIGVDIFFVISGYLITCIIRREIDGDRFTLGGFYRRCALRILPALLIMLVVVLAVGWWRLFPQDVRDLSWSAAATALSGSNIWFWRTVSYFGDAELKVLPHTWSLGVEEQFYIF
jgi:peptidoglycan/LPS O-acetylase OafA/YrhL